MHVPDLCIKNNYLFVIVFSISANKNISSKVLYKGTGAMRITLGSLQSAITPFFVNSSNMVLPFS
jgi:hypothetical protein